MSGPAQLVPVVSEEARRYWQARDPLKLLTEFLLGKGGLGKEKLDTVDVEATVVVDEAVRYADSLPFPRAATVTERLFAPRESR